MGTCLRLAESVPAQQAELLWGHVPAPLQEVRQLLHVVRLVEVARTHKVFVVAVLIPIIPIRVQVAQVLQPIVFSSKRGSQTIVVRVRHNAVRQHEAILQHRQLGQMTAGAVAVQ